MVKDGRRYKKLICLFLVLTIVSLITVTPFAASYPGYNYDSFGNSSPVPNGYTVETVFSGSSDSKAQFKEPTDLYYRNGLIYVLDNGNKRLVILNEDYTLSGVIDKFFLTDGTVYEPGDFRSVFVTDDNRIVITDNGNACVLVCDNNGKIQQRLEKPDSALFADDILFSPIKALADNKNNIYVISHQFYYGAVVYNSKGEFTGYFGANKVVPTLSQLADIFWRRIMTDKQVSYMARYVPVAYNSFDVDDKGFIYTCTGTVESSLNEIKKLNYLGSDVLQNANDFNPGNKEDYGDIERAKVDNTVYDTDFTDICISKDGFISALDKQKGRIFQYDQNSNLVTVFGGLGSQLGIFKEPVAVQDVNGKILVADKEKSSVTVFSPTEYGNYLQTALKTFSSGNYEKSKELWQQVLRLNSGCELAYRGIGRALLHEGNYKDAMNYLELGQDREGYSEAFRQLRAVNARKVFPYLLIVVVLLIVYFFVHKQVNGFIKRIFKIKDRQTEKKPGFFYGIVHPVLYYEYLFEKKSKRQYVFAFISVILLVIAKTAEYMATGFIFNQNDLNTFNILPIIASSFGLVILWCVSDWMTGSLRYGEGTFVKIAKATAYATLPYTVTVFIKIALSNILTLEESAVLTLVSIIGLVYSAYLLYLSVKTMQQYSTSGTLVMILADVAVAVLILFILVLIFNLIREFSLFAGTVYNEIAYRL